MHGADGEVLAVGPDGEYTYISGAGWSYAGSFNEWGQTGTGRFVFADMSVYEGEFFRGYANGAGTYYAPEGWSYEGSFTNGAMDAEGILTGEDGLDPHSAWPDGERETTNG